MNLRKIPTNRKRSLKCPTYIYDSKQAHERKLKIPKRKPKVKPF